MDPTTLTGIGAGAAVIGGGLSYLGSLNEQRGQNEAMKAEQDMLAQIIQQYQAGVGKATPLLTPFAQGGTQAFNTLSTLTGPGQQAAATNMTNFREDPQYKAILNSAMSAVQNSSAARGGLYSGGAGQDLATAAGRIADQAYQQIYGNKNQAYQEQVGNLSSVAGQGQSAASTLASLFTGESADISKVLGEIGGVQGAGITGAMRAQDTGLSGINTAIQSGIGLGLNQYNASLNRQQYDTLNRQQYDTLINLLTQGNNASSIQGGPG